MKQMVNRGPLPVPGLVQMNFGFDPAATGVIGSDPTLPFTFTSIPIGPADATRIVVICFQWLGEVHDARSDCGTIKINGIDVTANVAKFWSGGDARGHAIVYAPVPTGTTCTFTFDCPSGTGFINSITHETAYLTGNANAGIVNSIITAPPGYHSDAHTSDNADIVIPPGGVGITSSFYPTFSTTSWSGASSGFEDLVAGPVLFGEGGLKHHMNSGNIVWNIPNNSGGFIYAGFG